MIEKDVLYPSFSFFDNSDSILMFFKAVSLKSLKFFSFLKDSVNGWSGAIAINYAPKIVSGLVVKTSISLATRF